MVITTNYCNCFQILMRFFSRKLFLVTLCWHFRDNSSALFSFCLLFHFQDILDKARFDQANIVSRLLFCARALSPPLFDLQVNHLSLLLLHENSSIYVLSCISFTFEKVLREYLLILIYHFTRDSSFNFRLVTVLIPDKLSIFIFSILLFIFL